MQWPENRGNLTLGRTVKQGPSLWETVEHFIVSVGRGYRKRVALLWMLWEHQYILSKTFGCQRTLEFEVSGVVTISFVVVVYFIVYNMFSL